MWTHALSANRCNSCVERTARDDVRTDYDVTTTTAAYWSIYHWEYHEFNDLNDCEVNDHDHYQHSAADFADSSADIAADVAADFADDDTGAGNYVAGSY